MPDFDPTASDDEPRQQPPSRPGNCRRRVAAHRPVAGELIDRPRGRAARRRTCPARFRTLPHGLLRRRHRGGR